MLRRTHLFSRASPLRPTALLLGKTNRYTDGTGRPMDGSEDPNKYDLYLPPLNDTEKPDSYPERTTAWQPMVQGKASPYRGSVVVTGAGAVGSTAALLFGLRGWHVTVVEQGLPASLDASGLDISSSPMAPQTFECALMTKRGMDVLHSAGLRHKDMAQLGTKVRGVLDHPSDSLATIFTRGLAELHSFSVNNVVVDMHALRKRLHTQLNRMPHQNGKIFFEHKAVAHLPEQKVLVVKPLAADKQVADSGEINSEERGVMIHGVKFEDNVEGINYDLLLAADGRGSAMRRMMALDDDAQFAEANFAMVWFVVENCNVDSTVIHRWLHAFPDPIENPLKEHPCVFAFPRGADTGCFSVMAFVPNSVAQYYFGSEEEQHAAAAAADAKRKEGAAVAAAAADGSTASASGEKEIVLDDAKKDATLREQRQQQPKQTREERALAFVKIWCRDLLGGTHNRSTSPLSVMQGTVSPKPQPAPSLFLMHHYNVHTPFPNSILLGDAAHSCHPFLFQNLSIALEDCAYAVNILDAKCKNANIYDRIRQFSQERGVAADRLRNITDRSLYYHKNKHWNHLLRLRNFYAHAMHIACPRYLNEKIRTNSNFRYPRSVEAMLNGRGYTNFEEIDSAQVRTNRFYAFARLFT